MTMVYDDDRFPIKENNSVVAQLNLKLSVVADK